VQEVDPFAHSRSLRHALRSVKYAGPVTEWYPELRGDERSTLEQFLDQYRHTVLTRLDGLTDAQAGELAMMREALEAAVNAHADRTAESLGDG